LILSDGLMLISAFALAYWLRFYGGLAVDSTVTPSPMYYARIIAVLLPVLLCVFGLFRLYSFENLLGGTTEYSKAFNGCTVGIMLIVLASFVEPDFVIARGWIVMAWLLSAVFVLGSRFVLRRVAYKLREMGMFVVSAIMVGTNEEAVALTHLLRDHRSSGVQLVGIVDNDTNRTRGHRAQSGIAGVPIVGSTRDLDEIIRIHGVDEVIVATTSLRRDQLLELYERLAPLPNVQLRLSYGLFEVLTSGVQVRTYGSVPLLGLKRVRLDPFESFMKTMLDYCLTLPAVIALLPVFAVIALLIKLDSPGPVFHRRRVLGVGGKPFDAFKFRTMVVNGDEVLARHPHLLEELRKNHKLKDDPRVTRMGKWLRRYSLDELPQLFNVLLGQMSLVGPRMISPQEADMYGRMQWNLYTVKPGLTGLWQVSGRSDVSYENRVRLDLYYIRNYTIWLDLQILFVQTLPVVLKGQGAY
jgi:exopolysaccharide biosynthesis polyprenyl glycosylphosphotransferase